MSVGQQQQPFRARPDPEADPKGILMLAYRHIKWGLVSKLLQRALSWHPWIPGSLKLDSILSLFKCAKCYLDGQEDTRDVPGLDLHGDVEVQADPELLEGHEVSAAGAEERSGLDFVGAGNHVDVALPPTRRLTPEMSKSGNSCDVWNTGGGLVKKT